MAQKERSKELWLIPKRVNLHQAICLIDGIIERNYDQTSWSDQKQNNLGVNLKKWGATKTGKNISSQAIRTLVAAIPQYLGFVYVNTASRPSTICLTQAGKALWQKHRNALVKIPNLNEGKKLLIKESEIVLHQMEKLQITNPVIQKDCENILVFPFRFLLKVLLETEYLDQEEIAYFLFRVRREEELDEVVQAVLDFRKLSVKERLVQMDAFKKTHIGNITLVKASSAGYFISLCQITGIMERLTLTPVNREGSLIALKIKQGCHTYVKDMLARYQKAEPYDFGDDLDLYIDYMGNPERAYPPIPITLHNALKKDVFLQVWKQGSCKYDEFFRAEDILKYPMFTGESYSIKCIDITSGQEISEKEIIPDFGNRDFAIEGTLTEDELPEETIEALADQMIEHCEAPHFAGKTLHYLKTLSKVTGTDKTTDKSLRGAYLEYLVYKMLERLKQEGIIDAVVWNGKIGKYGLPVSAPGGKTGTPDIIIIIGTKHIVLELTTIKAKSLQFQAEGSSVPDHIRLYKEETKCQVSGVFCAPVIHERNEAVMCSALAPYGINLHCITVEQLADLLKSKDRNLLIKDLS